MLRLALLAALAVAVLLPAHVAAQPPGTPGAFQLVDVQADGGDLVYTTTQTVPVQKAVVVAVNVNGKIVNETRTVVVFEFIQSKQKVELKAVTATDGTGKAIPADKLGELLKAATPVVLLSGPISEKQRGLFKEKTVFIELPAPKGPPVVPPKAG